MCGIIGEFSRSRGNNGFMVRRDRLSHRGPDGTGFFVSPDGNLRLGHRRLSIIDLSKRGKQPMIVNGYAVTYNGEVYNFQALREEIGEKFSSETDTEVILRGYIKYGSDFFARLNGMFALGIYDPQSSKLILARDRLGIKPLYYYQDPSRFSFASEIQALGAPRKINLAAVQAFLSQNYVYGDEEILLGVRSLPPGTYGVWDLARGNFEVKHYHQTPPIAKITSLDPFAAEQECLEIFKDSVKQSLISDVPLGVFLSSGIDSSLIVALAQRELGELKTFTVGFDFSSFDESKRAGEIAKILGTDHHVVHLNKREVVSEIPKIIDCFHQPFGDSGALPFYFLSKYARQHVKVCLSGDGADELFGGYPLYYLPSIARIYQKLPVRNLINRAVSLLPVSFGKLAFDEKIRRFASAAAYDYQKAHFLYRAMRNEGVLKSECEVQPSYFRDIFMEAGNRDITEQLMYVDQKTILRHDYLVKVDRMSMAHGLEVRVPFLNNPVVEFSNRLSSKLKVRGLTTKYLLKRLLERYLPRHLIYRKKEGFSFPMASWLCVELKDFMLETLSRENVEETGFLEYATVRRMIESHLARRVDYNREIWGLISLVRYITHGIS